MLLQCQLTNGLRPLCVVNQAHALVHSGHTSLFISTLISKCLSYHMLASGVWRVHHVLSIMISAYTSYYRKLPHHIFSVLQKHGFTELHPDGELLLLVRLEEPDLWDQLIQEMQDSLELPGRHMASTTVDILNLLTDKASSGTLSSKLSELQLELLVGARKKLRRTEPHVDLQLMARKWRHWKPCQSKDMEPLTQRSLESTIKQKWLLRLIAIFLPFGDSVPRMREVSGMADPLAEYTQLFGKTRFSTIRGHCLMLERMLKLSSAPGTSLIPWTDLSIRQFLNQALAEGWSANLLDRAWKTLSYLSRVLGLMAPDSLPSLRAKLEAMCETLIGPSLSTPKQAVVPTMAIVKALETATTKGPQALRYCASHARFLLGCSARWNDGQHVLPSTVVLRADTVEAMAWQTKSSSARQAVKKPIPLISPLHSFTGVHWWIPMVEGLKFLSTRPLFQDMDYLLPRLSRDLTGFLPRPASYNTSLSALRKLLLNHVPPEEVVSFTWHSLRVFMPHWSFVAGVEPHKRQYLGRWTNESTADVYVRSHRTMICDIWQQVTDSGSVPQSALVLEDTGEPISTLTTSTVEPNASGALGPVTVVDAEEDGHDPPQPPLSENSHILTSQGASGPVAQTDHAEPTPADFVDPPQGPLHVVVGKRKTGSPPSLKIHLFTPFMVAVGCGWSPSRASFDILEEIDLSSDMTQCVRCFKLYTYPSDWAFVPDKAHTGTVSDMSSASDTASSDDTASECEKLPG